MSSRSAACSTRWCPAGARSAGPPPARRWPGSCGTTPPPLTASGQAVPEALERAITRCLEKDPAARFHSARDLAVALRDTVSTSGLPAARAARPAARLRLVGWAVAAAVALAVILVGLKIGRPRESPGPLVAPGQIQSVAVLPFENLSRDPKQEYFCDGMTDSLITDLAGVAALRVISRASVLAYKETRKPLPQIAKELAVDAVVQGSVLWVGDRVRINVQLVEAATDRHLWARSYDRHLDDVLALQKEAAQGIAGEIRVKLNAHEQVRLAEVPRVQPAAYLAYRKGCYFLNKRTEQDLKTAIGHFTEANDADPTYAPAWAGLADCYNFLGYGNYLSPRESFLKAEAAAARARDLDPNLADAHASLGYVQMYYHWKFPEAEAAFRRAIALNPNSATAHHLYSIYLTAMQRWDEAKRVIERPGPRPALRPRHDRHGLRAALHGPG